MTKKLSITLTTGEINALLDLVNERHDENLRRNIKGTVSSQSLFSKAWTAFGIVHNIEDK